jgi:hypothetical protein
MIADTFVLPQIEFGSSRLLIAVIWVTKCAWHTGCNACVWEEGSVVAAAAWGLWRRRRQQKGGIRGMLLINGSLRVDFQSRLFAKGGMHYGIWVVIWLWVDSFFWDWFHFATCNSGIPFHSACAGGRNETAASFLWRSIINFRRRISLVLKCSASKRIRQQYKSTMRNAGGKV